MRAGRLNARVRIERLTAVQDPAGQPVEQWVCAAAVWAEILPLRGREFWAAKQVQSEVTHQISLRYFRGLTAAMRLVHCERVFTISSAINVDEMNREWRLLCVERTPDAGADALGRHFA
jgi:SPP1 family predicted phage head-tail adaptor